MDAMDRDLAIKTAMDRMEDVYKKRPSVAQSTSSVTGTIDEGLTCSITDGHHTVVSDLPVVMGGNDAGPTPGYYARAGIAGCVGIGIKMNAARAGHDFRSVRVIVETDFDDRAAYKLCDETAAPIETRLKIEIDSDLEEDELAALVEDVLEHDTWFLALRDAQFVRTSISALARD